MDVRRQYRIDSFMGDKDAEEYINILNSKQQSETQIKC